MRSALRRPGFTILALQLLAAGSLGAAPQAAPPPAPPAHAASPAVATPPPPPPPGVEENGGGFHLHDRDVDVEMEGGDHDVITIVRGPHSYIGVRLLDLTPELRELYTGSKDSGVLVSSVEADSPAAKAGIRVGDVVVKVGGESVSRAWEIGRAIRRKEAGQTVKLEVRRGKDLKSFEAAVAERKGTRREIRIPDLGGPGFTGRTEEWAERISEQVERALARTEEKLRRIDERLKELERRWEATK
jgi:membrane-associated protease RseP (regulator of RpoE activity)